VTGATGYIGSHVVKSLLEKGYSVRGTVRSLGNEKRLEFLRAMPGASDNLELVEANLISTDGWDDAMKDITEVMHVASPFFMRVKKPQEELVTPAVQGTENVLNAAKKAGSVKKIVLTSSMAAVFDEVIDGKVFDESCWNELSSLKRNPYYFSKVCAEKRAWELQKEHDSYKLITINPGLVYGPSNNEVVGESCGTLRDFCLGKVPGCPPVMMNIVDVRDVATAHIAAMESDSASGRYCCFERCGNFLEVSQAIERNFPGGYKVPKKQLGVGLVKFFALFQPAAIRVFLRLNAGRTLQADNSKIKRELGLEFLPFDTTIKDTIDAFIAHGIVPPPRVPKQPKAKGAGKKKASNEE